MWGKEEKETKTCCIKELATMMDCPLVELWDTTCNAPWRWLIMIATKYGIYRPISIHYCSSTVPWNINSTWCACQERTLKNKTKKATETNHKMQLHILEWRFERHQQHPIQSQSLMLHMKLHTVFCFLFLFFSPTGISYSLSFNC